MKSKFSDGALPTSKARFLTRMKRYLSGGGSLLLLKMEVSE